MDLRIHLIRRLATFFLMLLLFAVGLVFLALLEDVEEEVAASARLAELMRVVGSDAKDRGERVERMIAEGGMRHLAVAFERSESEQMPRHGTGRLTSWVMARLDLAGEVDERRIPLGDEVLVLVPDPSSEVTEILTESLRMILLFCGFLVVAVAATWRTVGAALAPVRELEAGLLRLAAGEPPALPPFELREFERIGSTMEAIARRLADAREAERRLGRRLIELQEEERRALARELHDEFGQTLTAIGVAAAYVERHAGVADAATLVACARDVREQAARMSRHVSGLLRELRPHGLEGLGMLEAVRDLLEAWSGRHGGVELVAELADEQPQLGSSVGLVVYRLIQESLTNVHKHSGAQRVELRLKHEHGLMRLTVADDGRGCRSDVCERSSGGLLGMRERASMVGGKLSFESAPGRGFKVLFEVSVATAAVVGETR